MLRSCLVPFLTLAVEPFYKRHIAIDAREDQASYQPDKADKSQFMRAIRLRRDFVYKPGEFKDDLDSANSYFSVGYKLAAQLKCDECKVETINLSGAILYERSDPIRAIILHEHVADIASRMGDFARQAKSWYLVGEVQNSLISQIVSQGYLKSLELFGADKNIQYQAYVLTRIG